MRRVLTLWRIIAPEGAEHFVERVADAGVTRLIGPRAPEVVSMARSLGIAVHAYVTSTPFPTHGQRPRSFTWSLDYIAHDPRSTHDDRSMAVHETPARITVSIASFSLPYAAANWTTQYLPSGVSGRIS